MARFTADVLADFFAADFFAADSFAADFFAADFLTAGFFVTDFFTADFAGVTRAVASSLRSRPERVEALLAVLPRASGPAGIFLAGLALPVAFWPPLLRAVIVRPLLSVML